MRNRCIVYCIEGLSEYKRFWKYQKMLAHHLFIARKNGTFEPDRLIMLQHSSIYTLGRAATEDNLKFSPHNSGHRVVRVERGGEVTWHGPGQLVAYPIFDLYKHKKDLRWFTKSLEETVILTAKSFGISGERSEVNTGVWVGKNKISAIGVSASRWITMHGCSVNVDCDMSHFQQIVPCGIKTPGYGVSSLQIELSKQDDCRNRNLNETDSLSKVDEDLFTQVRQQFISNISAQFCLDVEFQTEDELQLLDEQYGDESKDSM